MVLLSKSWAARSFAVLASMSLACGCSSKVTLVAYVDTDTYISSADLGNHSEQPTLRISNTGGIEERTLLKLPTGKQDRSDNFDEIFGNLRDPLTWPLLPFVILVDIFASFFNCTTVPLSAVNLSSAFLVLNVNQNTGSAPLTQITIQHLAKPWWQSVSWHQAFPFSSSGTWSQPGGDLDSSFTPIAAIDGGDGTIKFDVTSYFKTLLAAQNVPHYGFVMRSAGGSALSQVLLESVQSTDAVARPRLVSTYNCVNAMSLRESVAAQPEPYTYYLGPHSDR